MGRLFYVVICVLLAAFLLGQYIYPSERETVTEESITFTGTFYRVLADGTEQEIQVPGRGDVPAGELLEIRWPSDTLWRMCIFTSEVN